MAENSNIIVKLKFFLCSLKSSLFKLRFFQPCLLFFSSQYISLKIYFHFLRSFQVDQTWYINHLKENSYLQLLLKNHQASHIFNQVFQSHFFGNIKYSIYLQFQDISPFLPPFIQFGLNHPSLILSLGNIARIF